jgi:hypothetical protein
MSRTCIAIVHPHQGTECGKPAHLDTGHCIQHLPDAPKPRVDTTSTRGQYNVGVFCTCLHRWHWEIVKARTLKAAKVAAIPVIKKLYQESADRWDGVRLQARDAGSAQRQQSVFFTELP